MRQTRCMDYCAISISSISLRSMALTSVEKSMALASRVSRFCTAASRCTGKFRVASGR